VPRLARGPQPLRDPGVHAQPLVQGQPHLVAELLFVHVILRTLSETGSTLKA
jgi:hypothetical protein